MMKLRFTVLALSRLINRGRLEVAISFRIEGSDRITSLVRVKSKTNLICKWRRSLMKNHSRSLSWFSEGCGKNVRVVDSIFNQGVFSSVLPIKSYYSTIYFDVGVGLTPRINIQRTKYESHPKMKRRFERFWSPRSVSGYIFPNVGKLSGEWDREEEIYHW